MKAVFAGTFKLETQLREEIDKFSQADSSYLRRNFVAYMPCLVPLCCSGQSKLACDITDSTYKPAKRRIRQIDSQALSHITAFSHLIVKS